jgi:glutamate synthase domain-containing protein 2
MSPRRIFVLVSVAIMSLIGVSSLQVPEAAWSLALFGPIILVGVLDMTQTKHAVRRNFPVIGHGRYLLEAIRPEINQYFVESNLSGTPFNRERRSIVYQRAKRELDTLPFGTENDVYAPGYEWMEHSLLASEPPSPPRVEIGGARCTKPYRAALLNVSAMSYGSLSRAAIEALNLGAKQGGFSHNTGEGGLSPYHEMGGDLVWQIGTGYFGCRSPDGGFSEEEFVKRATKDVVKMIEIKLSQGAKPGHGGILPAVKLTQEIATIRGVPLGRDVISPPTHTAFRTPVELVRFAARLRELSGGKPVGIKLCVGRRHELFALCKAMIELDDPLDFITVDGGEGGTGAAPLEFSNQLGTPMQEGLLLVHNTLVGCGLRDRVRVIVSGKVITGFDMVRAFVLGADLCNAARAMMFALGCIQARRCNTNHCPVGIATQNPALVVGLVVPSKAQRVHNFQHETVHAMCELLGAAGMRHPSELRPEYILRRMHDGSVRTYAQIHRYLPAGALLSGPVPEGFEAWASVRPDSFSLPS